jgi:CDGSH-type Zn-finger protein/uncharacterized Fe-S cluster protein YjdI
MSEKSVVEYPGAEIDVQWDGRLCIHVGECGKAEGELFVGDRQPWCVPDKVAKADVRDVIERCPTGALTYRDKDGAPEAAPAENTLMVAYNGPYYVKGDLQVEGAPEDMPGVRHRAALCRCGVSKNKPFCDNSHLEVRFEDFGAVGEKGPGLTASGGPVSVKPLKDGPLRLDGNLTMYAASGRAAWRGDSLFLCRCGASNNKPFCDGSHRAAGFKSD